MLLPILLLPLAAVLINDAKTEYANNTLTIDIATTKPVTREDVRGITGGAHRMYVYLNDTVANRREFGSGPETILVHPRIRYTKLEIPTPGHCAEPVAIEQTTTGIRVRATCREAGSATGSVAPPLHARTGSGAQSPEPDPAAAARLRDKGQSDVLRAALALPTETAGPAKAAETGASDRDHRGGSAKSAGDNADEGEGAGAKEGSAGTDGPATGAGIGRAAGPAVLAAATTQASPPSPNATATPSDTTRGAVAGNEKGGAGPGSNSAGVSSSGSSLGSMVLAVLLLAGLGVGGVVFGRRHVKRNRLIRIVETASIGPRRSLVVACIGGRTMVLGVSEAGVSLLDAQGSSALAPDLATETQSSSLEAAMAGLGQAEPGVTRGREETAETKNESSLLTRLFQRPKRPARESADFDGLLSESLEDEDLRRKLALGEAGRVA